MRAIHTAEQQQTFDTNRCTVPYGVPLAEHRDRTPQASRQIRQNRPMCVGGTTNPDVPADCCDAFDSDEDAPDAIEDEHHAIFECSGAATTRQMFSDLFPSHVSTVSHFLNQPDCNRLAKFLTWIRMLRLNNSLV